MDDSIEQKLRKHRCCFTGHRPEKLNCDEKMVKAKLKSAIQQAIQDEYVTFIVGMCRGIDLWAGEIVLDKKRKNSDLHLVAAIPHPDFERNWCEEDKTLYFKVLKNADIAKTIGNTYYKACYQKRNIWMAEHSSRVIAAYNGKQGGTRNTIKYAQNQGMEIINIFDK